MSIESILIGVVVVALVIGRQLRRRPVREGTPLYLVGGLAVLGLATLAQGIAQTSHARPDMALTLLLLALVFAVSAGGGVLRGLSVHVWRDAAGRARRQGGALTVALWLASIVIHVGLDRCLNSLAHAAALGPATLSLSLALTLGAQSLVVRRRAAILPTSPASRNDERAGFDRRFQGQADRGTGETTGAVRRNTSAGRM